MLIRQTGEKDGERERNSEFRKLLSVQTLGLIIDLEKRGRSTYRPCGLHGVCLLDVSRTVCPCPALPPPATRLPPPATRHPTPQLTRPLPESSLVTASSLVDCSSSTVNPLESRDPNGQPSDYHCTTCVIMSFMGLSHGHLVTLFIVLFFMMLDLHYYRDAIITITSFTDKHLLMKIYPVR